LKTIVIVAIALALSIGIVAAVFVVGGMYQKELFDEYIEDVSDSQSPRQLTNPNLPVLDPFP
jgi:hypothetical protein